MPSYIIHSINVGNTITCCQVYYFYCINLNKKCFLLQDFIISVVHVELNPNLFLPQVLSSGVFELKLVDFKNNRGVNHEGNCCTGIREGGICRETCKTFFRICLNHYQATISPDPKCTFGEVTTPVIGDNTFQFPPSLDSFRGRP